MRQEPRPEFLLGRPARFSCPRQRDSRRRRYTSTTTFVVSDEFQNGTECATVSMAAQSTHPINHRRNFQAMAEPVLSRTCPHCQSTTTICTAGTFDREVWQCRTCRRHFAVALLDDQRQGPSVSAAVERPALRDPANVRCPQCGYGGGLSLAPKEERTASTPVRCFSCGADSAIERWQNRAQS